MNCFSPYIFIFPNARYAQTIAQSADSLLHIINNLLDLSKAAAGKMQLEKIPFNLSTLCAEVVELLSPSAQEKGIQFFLSFAPECPERLIGDPGPAPAGPFQPLRQRSQIH